jgi:hypothetical protein
MKLRFQHPDMPGPELTVRFLRDGKVLAKIGEESVHYTLHPGRVSGLIDLHKTNESLPRGDPAKYNTLGVLPAEVIVRAVADAAKPLLAGFLGLWRPLRLGWMIRRRLGIGPRFPSDIDAQGISGISIRKGPILVNDPLATLMNRPEYYEDVLREANAGYILYDCGRPSHRPYGLMVTYAAAPDQVRMMWAKIRDLKRWSKSWEPVLLGLWHQSQRYSRPSHAGATNSIPHSESP